MSIVATAQDINKRHSWRLHCYRIVIGQLRRPFDRYTGDVAYDAAVSLRAMNNERLRISLGWGEYRDLGGALALTSDVPLQDLNRLEAFTTDARRTDGLLDIGFALLRAFDCRPAVCVTPLDRPASLPAILERRGLRVAECSATMVYRPPAATLSAGVDVDVRRATAQDAPLFRDLIAGSKTWLRRLMLATTVESMQHAGHSFYIAYVESEPAGTLHLLIDNATAGIYAVHTRKERRRRGVATALLSAAIRAALAAGCDVITLRTQADGEAQRFFERRGFEVAHLNTLWALREPS